jgi:hypothetical protein
MVSKRIVYQEIYMTIRNNTPKASQRRHFINRRLRFATPTVNKVLSLQDKWEHKFRGIIADSHKLY